MIAAEIAATLGHAHRSGGWWRCRCPVHDSRGATLALRNGEHGLIAVCHAGCPRDEILAELRRRELIRADNAGTPQHRAGPVRRLNDRGDEARRTAIAWRIWGRGKDALGTPVAAYLGSRGIVLPPPRSLRWAPRCWHSGGRAEIPAMVSRVDDVNGRLIGVHRTYLTHGDDGIWRRRDRASLGPISGGSVRLAPLAGTLMVGEGIETCLAAMQATAMPAWAALSASGLVTLALPPSVRKVVILADNDVSGAGERASRTAAQRWLIEGRQVRLAMPPEPGTDFADVLLGQVRGHFDQVRDVAA